MAAGLPWRFMASGRIKHAKEMEVARGIANSWKKVRPLEYAQWKSACKFLSEVHEWTGGWSESKELMAIPSLPANFMHGMKHGLILLGWHEQAANAWDREREGNRWVPSKLYKTVVRELMPEAQTTRKERRLRSFHGVDLPAS